MDEIVGRMLRDVFACWGKAALYLPAGGDPVPCRVIVDHAVEMQPAGMTGQAWQRETTIEAILSEIGGEPNRGDSFVVGEEEYLVMAVRDNDARTCRVLARAR